MADLQRRVFDNIRLFISTFLKDQKFGTDSLEFWLLSVTSISWDTFVPVLDLLVNQLTEIQHEIKAIKPDHRPTGHIEEMGSADVGEERCRETTPPPPWRRQAPQSTSAGQEINSHLVCPMRKACIDKNLIQITANKSEIDRRIAAFIEQKRLDVDEENRREFCSEFFPYHVEKEHCARTGAVFVPRSGTRSHVAVSRVENINGPQLHIPSSVPTFSMFSRIKHEMEDPVAVKQELSNIPSGVEERVSNMADHLHIERADSNQSQVFDTLKQLEKRILFLESLSPEYFEFHDQLAPERKRKHSAYRTENPPNQDLSMWEINRRIKTLQESLKRKHMKAM